MLQCVEDDCIAWFGVKCSSSSTVNMGTSRRSFLLPEGDGVQNKCSPVQLLGGEAGLFAKGGSLLFSATTSDIPADSFFLDRSVLLMVSLCCQWWGFHPGEPQNIVDVPPSQDSLALSADRCHFEC